MPTVGLKLSSWNYKRTLKNSIREKNGALLITRKSEPRVSPNASFIDGVACKDCIIDATTGVSIRVYLPEICRGFNRAGSKAFSWLPESASTPDESSDFQLDLRSFFEATEDKSTTSNSSCDDDRSEDFLQSNGAYYPQRAGHKKLPAIIQFHAGAFVNGSKDAPSNDLFCRRIAKACRSVVITVGYRLAPEHKFPSARDDGLATLRWLARQANLAIFSSSDCSRKSSSGLIDSFANMLSDPWITAHVDYSRCVVMGVGAGGTIAEQVTRVAMNMCLELEPLQISAQVLVCPLFSGVTPLPSEILLSDTYFIDRDTLALIWRLVLPEGENHLDHPAVDPLLPSEVPALKQMPSTLVVSAELDMLRDRAAAYVDALQRNNVDASILTYRAAVHGFVTLECLMNTRAAQACIEDIAIWFERHVKHVEHDWN